MSVGGADEERALRRSLGPTAWAVLADLHLDPSPDGPGATVVATSARRVASHLGITKDTAARALRRLTAAGIVRRRPQATSTAGRFAPGTYELLLDLPTAPRRPNRDTVKVAGSSGPAKTPARRRYRTTRASQPAQLSLLEPASVHAASDAKDAR